jgi:hypothetical protein
MRRRTQLTSVEVLERDLQWFYMYSNKLLPDAQRFPLKYISWFIQSGPLYTKHNNNHIAYCGTKIKSEAGPPMCNTLSQPPPWHSSQGCPWCLATAHASCAKAVQVRAQYIHAQNACSVLSINYVRTNFKQCISCSNGIRLQELGSATGFLVLCVKVLRSEWVTAFRRMIVRLCLQLAYVTQHSQRYYIYNFSSMHPHRSQNRR